MAATIWFCVVVVICLGMYVVLDGYDLGIGMLTLTERDDKTRRQLIEVVATAWDGNETWLILLAVTLFGGLPTAYGAALPALYVPIVVMLLALVFRGAAIERVSNTVGVPRGWGLAFGVGSLVAAFAQGVTIGGALSGIAFTNGQFSGGTFDFMTKYAVLTGVTTVVLYCAAGAAYVQLKTTGDMRARAASLGRLLTLATGLLTLACATLLAPWTPVRVGAAGTAATGLAVIAAVAALAGLATSLSAFGRGPDERPLIGIVAAEGFGLVALALLYYPTALPPGLTVDQAKAPAGTLNFLMIASILSLPVLLYFNWYTHRVFRGKYREPSATAALAGSRRVASTAAHSPARPRRHPKQRPTTLRWAANLMWIVAGTLIAAVSVGVFAKSPAGEAITLVALVLIVSAGAVVWLRDELRHTDAE
ncbi:cytochrome d ubiquinol oxidase subunit II [Mycobacterium sp. E1386]|uniref:cytochrome d ubiquinol oxidase subunit II n=1 Tax=Mycobacterium sp. E1386 TaxID=1834126 RepID=UPI000801A9F2|nr:cytochrome d ubiquinol oxidase subunit II [Mycobacterium sp. E1386]OBI27646.1 cytochrome d ubiquinol oxidase subunit II [Mycobacterium sp. E1386]